MKDKIEIKLVKQYICPVTGKAFGSEAAARKSATLAMKEAAEKKAKEDLYNEQANWLRLNLTHVRDIGLLMKTKAKEFWGLDFKSIQISGLWFTDVATTHDCPIGQKTSDFGSGKRELRWQGRLTASLTKALSRKGYTDGMVGISDLLMNDGYSNTGFYGFHTGTGCRGIPDDLKCPADISFHMYLKDFPLLLKQYEEYLELKKKLEAETAAMETRLRNAHDYACSRPYVQDLQAKEEMYRLQRDEAYEQFKEQYMAETKVEPVVLPPTYEIQRQMFHKPY